MVSASSPSAGYACVYFHCTIGNNQTLLIEGEATVEQYQALLSSITYENVLSEPTRGNRTIYFLVFDGIFESNVATVTVDIHIIPDSPLFVSSCGDEPVLYVEGGDPVTVAPSLMLMDADVDHVVTEARVEVLSPAEGDYLMITVGQQTQLVRESDTVLSISGQGNVQQFQVRTFTNWH